MRLRLNVKKPTGLRYLGLLAGIALSLMLCRGFWIMAVAQDGLTPAENRGRQIYTQGTSPSGKEILAYLGESSLEIPGSSMACANCHGLDGQGKPEGGLNPSNLTWESLTKPYGVSSANGRSHPPYTERGLELAITRGVDPGGNKLQNFMPRYQVSREDLADLILYLKRLREYRDPGISEDKIAIGTAVPGNGALADLGRAVRAEITAFFAEANAQGGVYNRGFELKFIEITNPPSTRASLEHFLKDERVFAMIGTFIAGSEKELTTLMEELKVPMIGPFTLYPQISFPLNRQVFYLQSGIDEQARALIHFAVTKPELKRGGLAIISPKTEINASVIEAIRDQSTKDGLNPPETYTYSPGRLDASQVAKRFSQTTHDVVFFLGNGEEILLFMKEAEKVRWFPTILLPGPNTGIDIFDAPAGFADKLFFSFPTSPADQTPAGIKEFRALAEKYKLPPDHLAAQLSAFSAGKILVEGLKRAGRDVSREKLITALEGLNRFSTGLTPAITYGPNRRVGALGAYVCSVDLKKKQFVPASSWISTD
jgi:ABC-type branched-subunit amino acid transport system substrate-binding protein